MKKFCLILKSLREEKSLFQKQVAKELGTTQSNYSAWEIGRAQPSIEMLIKIAQFFDVSLDYLCGKTNDIMFNDEYQPQLEKLTTDKKRALELFSNLDKDSKLRAIGYLEALVDQNPQPK